jgi:hypothetical protein
MPDRPFAHYLAQAQAGDTTLDFVAFRLSFTKTPEYEPYGTGDGPRLDSVFAALDRDEFSLALARADSLLRENPVDAEGHAAAGYASASLHDSVAADRHWWIANGLILSIARSGAGTEASPMVVISVPEEYAYARFIKLKRGGLQSLVECGGRPCDRVEFVTRAEGRDTTLFFDVSIPMGHLERSLNVKD